MNKTKVKKTDEKEKSRRQSECHEVTLMNRVSSLCW